MTHEIFILHSSPIIQKGIESLVSQFANIPIYSIAYPSDIIKKAQTAYQQHFIIFTETELTQEFHQAFQQLQQQNKLSYVYILNEQEHVENLKDSHVISHYSSETEISQIINKLKTHTHVSKNQEQGGSISRREKEVLTLVALGFSNKEIAEELSISVHTVISHRKKIVKKTGIKSISGLTMYAIMTKIVDPNTIDMSKLI